MNCAVLECEINLDATLDDLHELGWSAFQISKGKVWTYCPQNETNMIKDISVGLKRYSLKSVSSKKK